RSAGERQAVGVATAGGHLRIERPGVADLLLGDAAHGDVALDIGAKARPLRVPVADDQLVVGGPQQPFPERRADAGIGGRPSRAVHLLVLVAVRKAPAAVVDLLLLPVGSAESVALIGRRR